MTFLIRWLPALGFIAALGIIGLILRWQIRREKAQTEAQRLATMRERLGFVPVGEAMKQVVVIATEERKEHLRSQAREVEARELKTGTR